MPLLGTTGRTGIEELLLFLVLAGGLGTRAHRIDELLLFILLAGLGDFGRRY